MQALNRTSQKTFVDKGIVAPRPWARMRGLIGRSSLESGEGLLLLGTKCIHTIGMRFAVDVLFLDEKGCVVNLIHAFKPFRISAFITNSAMVLELPAGVLYESGTEIGNQIEVTDHGRLLTVAGCLQLVVGGQRGAR